MSWLFLLFAGMLEVVWAGGLKYTHGFSRVGPSLVVAVALVASLFFLSCAMKTLPAGTAYAVWTGIGAVGVVLVGIWLEGEPASLGRLISMALIVLGIIGVKLFSQ